MLMRWMSQTALMSRAVGKTDYQQNRKVQESQEHDKKQSTSMNTRPAPTATNGIQYLLAHFSSWFTHGCGKQKE